MSLSVDAIRREMGMHRDRVVRLHHDESNLRQRIEQVETQLARHRQELEQIQTGIKHEEQIVDALQTAAALLAERMPSMVPVSLVESEPIEPELEPEHEEVERSRAAQRYVMARAAELDMTQINDATLERADLVAMILVDYGPLRQYQIAQHLKESGLIERQKGEGGELDFDTLASHVGNALPVLVRQGRVRPVEHGIVRYATWEATPPEHASAGLGAAVDNYAGTTTRWPSDSEKPAAGSRISIETSAFEGGKDR